MAAAALVGDVLLTGGMRPLARGLSVRHTTPASGASAARALSTLATRRLPAAGHSNRGSPRLHSASSASSFASVRCARLEHGKGFRAAVVRCASGDGTHPTALPTTAAEGEEGGVAPSHAAGSAAPPPPADSAPAPAKRASEVEAVPGTSFADLGMPKKLCAALERTGFTEPTAPQIATIPLLLDGKNIAMQSHTGSGKTLAYLLPVLARILLDGEKPVEERDNNVQCLVVVPSQELAMQIVRQMERVLGDFGKNITQQCIGGANVRRQEDAIRKKKPLVVVGTPGRLAELSRTGILQTHGVRCLVVDEADDLLASNFRRDMARICDHTGKGVLGGRQTVIVSATLRPETMDQYSYMAPNLMHVVAGQAAAALAHEQRRLSGGGEDGNEGRNGVSEDTGGGGVMNASLPPNLEHYSVVVGDRHKVDRLRKAIHATGAERALIFLNFGHRLAETRDKLATRGMDCGVLHGGLDKHERTSELAKFRRGDFRALLVSDLAARGIDVPEVDAVFNLELPTDETHYVHRAGRTGRMGAPGLVMSFAAPSEAFVLSRIGKKLGINIHAADLQNGQVVPDRGNTPTPRKVHELENEARDSRSGRGGRGGARSGRGGEREGDERDRGRAISAGRGGGGGRGGGSTSAARRDVRGGYNGRYDEYDHYIDNAYDRPERGRGEDAYGRPARGRGDNAYDRPARGRGDDAYDRPARGRGDGGGRGGGGGGSAGSGKPIHYTPKGQPRRRRKNAGGA